MVITKALIRRWIGMAGAGLMLAGFFQSARAAEAQKPGRGLMSLTFLIIAELMVILELRGLSISTYIRRVMGALLKIYDRDFGFDGEYHLEMVASMIWRKVASSSLLARYGNRARAWFSVLSAFV